MRKMSLSFIAVLAGLAVIAAVTLLTFISIADYSGRYEDSRLGEVRDTVLGCVAQCYALEGAYPPDLAYLEDNYGLMLDRSRYIYHYELFASNIFPDVKVLSLKGTGD
jgi:hypothetical protein